ncbi:hypothetical protein JCM8208_002404 [Rhodotorula glutinis]
MPSNPLPVHLPGECRKAQKILDSFANPVNGLDNVVPASVLRKAKGFCLLSVAKAGFLFSGRAGTGVVIARLDDGTWSAPSAVGTAGAGFGLQVGVELAEFLIILNSRAAVKSFMAAGSLTLGGNMSIAAGPLGRNLEGTGALSAKGAVAAMYSYSRTRGLFGGASVEGSIIVERSDANSKAYNQNVTAKQLLSGAIEPPSWALPLIETISRLATPARSLPGGGWSTDSPLESPRAPSTPGDIAADEEGYFSRARAQRRIEEEQEQGLTPREYKERGYAFGSASAQGGSSASPSAASASGGYGGGGGGHSSAGAGSPAKDKGGRFGAMLGSVGRSRSGSGSASASALGASSTSMSKKSSLGASASASRSTAVDDPFAEGAPAGPAVGNSTRFETHFADEFDFDSATAAASRSSGPSPQAQTPTTTGSGKRSPFGFGTLARDKDKVKDADRDREQDLMAFDGDDDDHGERDEYPSSSRPATSSRKDGPISSPDKGRSRASSSASNGNNGGSSSWFSKSTSSSSSSRPKLTKNRSSSNAAATSALRERASAMRWDAQPGDHGGEPGAWREFESDRGRGRDSFDLLDDDDRDRDGFDDFGRPAQRSSSPSYGNGIAARDRAATLAGGDTRRAPPASALAAAGGGRARAASSATQGLGASAYVPKPWDAPSSGVGGRARSGTGGSGGLDLRPVEADFERVLSLSKHGGDGEVGAASGIGAPSPAGGRSRSGTGGGLGTAVALFDFPGVESTDLPFKKGDAITILAMDDEEWWKGRLRLREGMIPRNYVEAHFS